jgi:hypothetical protein
MFAVVNDHVFPFLRTLGGDDSTYAHHMKDARFTIPKPALLVKVVDLLDQLPMDDRDTKGDLYEYMLGKMAWLQGRANDAHPGDSRARSQRRPGRPGRRACGFV